MPLLDINPVCRLHTSESVPGRELPEGNRRCRCCSLQSSRWRLHIRAAASCSPARRLCGAAHPSRGGWQGRRRRACDVATNAWGPKQYTLLKEGEDLFRQAELMLRQGKLQDADQLMAAARARMAQCSDCGVDVSPRVEVLQAPRPEKVLPGGAALIGLGVVTAMFAGPFLAIVLAITMTLGAVITSLFTFGVFLVPLVALGAFSVGGLGLVLLFFQPLVGALALGTTAVGLLLGIATALGMRGLFFKTKTVPAGGPAPAGATPPKDPATKSEYESECERLAQELRDFDKKLAQQDQEVTYRKKLRKEGLWLD